MNPNRGGALTTRSTHPWTFWRLRELLAALGIGLVLENPHEMLTKGELVRKARSRCSSSPLEEGIAGTLSCATLGGQRYGARAGMNCGLCVACLVRRGSITVDGHPDITPYVVDNARPDRLPVLLSNRRKDMLAVEWAIEAGISLSDLTATASFPPGYDFDSALGVCRRGLAELATVPLPSA